MKDDEARRASPPASARLAELAERDPVRIIAVRNPDALGFDGLAWRGITLEDDADLDEAASAIAGVPQLSYLLSVSSRFDLMGELVCRDRDYLLATGEDGVGHGPGIPAVETISYLRLLYRTTCGAWGAARARAIAPTTDRSTEEVRPVHQLR